MKQLVHMARVVSVMLLAEAALASCIYEGEELPDDSETIRVHTQAVDGSRAAVKTESGDNTFMVLFWRDKAHLESASAVVAAWSSNLYLAGHAPQPVAFYERSVFDTRYPYPPQQEYSYLYATGYAPGNVLKPSNGYRTLTASVGTPEKGRYDFLGCDVWSEVFRGSQSDPFSQDKNKLYFRHLAAKLVFYADRDRATMENRQFVRNVRIKNLQMSVGGGEWTPMYTPRIFEWKTLQDDDFTTSYVKTIATVKLVEGNTGVRTRPQAGYKAVEAEPFAGAGSNYVLQKNAADRVPIEGMAIDSCYVCNPIDKNGAVRQGDIRLKMDLSAEMSFDPNFPVQEAGIGSGSAADDITFTREWKDVVLDAIYLVDEKGDVPTNKEPVKEFKAGKEYRIYIRFNRTGVNLVARELPWNYGRSHYITIPGGVPQSN